MLKELMEKNPKILIVEDDLALRELYNLVLQEEGYRVDLKDSAEAVLDSLSQLIESPPSLGVFDHSLPGRSGVDLVKLLRENPELPRFPIISSSGWDNIDRRFFDGRVDKPFNIDVLLDEISRLLPKDSK